MKIMKKIILVFLLIFSVSPLWALFCSNCGKPIADDAKFCPQCGKARSPAIPGSVSSAPAPALAPAPVNVPVTPAPTPVPMTPPTAPFVGIPSGEVRESFLRAYEPINRFEQLLTSSNYQKSSSKAAVQRELITRSLHKIEIDRPHFSPVMDRIHTLYLKKNDLLEQYLDAWNRSERGSQKVQAEARKSKLLFMIAKTNEMIVLLKDNKSDVSILTRIDDLEKDLEESTREYRITAPFLKVNEQRVVQDQTLWVLEVQDARARVMVTGETAGNFPISGWVSISDLEKRTAWRPRYREVIFQSVPAMVPAMVPVVIPAPVTEVIIVEEDPWRRSHGYYPFFFFPPPFGHPFPHHENRHDGGHFGGHPGGGRDRGHPGGGGGRPGGGGGGHSGGRGGGPGRH
ncbi:MAG: zinc ribbon domain-containing protein [Candidatus Ozemobacteraceae bacterium]